MENKLPLIRKTGFELRYQYEKSIIEEEFPFLSCTFTSTEMKVRGVFSPTLTSNKYDVLIRFNAVEQPEAFILSPTINYNSDIHVYRNGSLCLHYPNDMSWSKNDLLAYTIIPWISEWLVYYELYQYYNKWKGPEKLHELL